MPELIQNPTPGKHRLFYCGDVLEVHLSADTPLQGRAFLCTNIGNAAIQRSEIIARTEEGITPGGQDWRNIPMRRIDERSFLIRLALTEEGHFECKCCFVRDMDSEPQWVAGDNLHINVSPAPYCCSNTVYCAFVRQFGMNRDKLHSSLPEGVTEEGISSLDSHGYSVIPPSGTFRDLIRELDHIVNRLKCRIIHLLPVTPAPTVYGRMGRYGSPYASLDFTEVDPSLAEFDRKATPLDQFLELVDAVHRKNAKLFIDIAINHTGWAARLHEEHPDWFVREPDGSIHSPGAWGVVWGDLTELDHQKPELWEYLAQVFRVWCSRGVDGFRCDAGYMIPAPAWTYIIARVREEYPETVFLLEGLGGDPAVTARLLDSANMDWAYSELFQNYSRIQIEGYLRYAWSLSAADGLLIHYAETHDNNRLAAVSAKYAKMRTALSALASVNGAFGFANGVEWFAQEKIDVHESSALNWGADVNQIDFIARLNVLLAVHPAFHDGATLMFLDSGTQDAVLFSRSSSDSSAHLLVAVNLNCGKGTSLEWNASYAPLDAEELTDLVSGRTFEPRRLPGHKRALSLSPGQACCFTDSPVWFEKLSALEKEEELLPGRIREKEASAMALRVLSAKNSSQILVDENIRDMARSLQADPLNFLRELYGDEPETPYVHWRWPADLQRELMLPPRHCLLATAPCRFRFAISRPDGKILMQANALPAGTGGYFAVLPPLPSPEAHRSLKAVIAMYNGPAVERREAPLLLLAQDVCRAALRFSRNEILHGGVSRTFLQANGKGAILHTSLERGRLNSRYDAVLLANLNPDYPEDRHVMWRRTRIWVVYHARLQEVETSHLSSFHVSADGGGVWNYEVPVGNGLFIELTVKLEIVAGRNCVMMTVYRRECRAAARRLGACNPVRLMVRTDLEDRNFHCGTKAAAGPEKIWPGQIYPNEKGFEFRAGSDRIFRMQISRGVFRRDDEWQYMVYQPNEASRGLDPHTDLYSPGYFRFDLAGDEAAYITGQVLTSPAEAAVPPGKLQKEPFAEMETPLKKTMLFSMRQFIVKRHSLKTVIAGYPWFLDWGRDTLIAARGLIAAPEFRSDVRAILLQFARFAEKGTIPNMISGDNADNRDTSDAPLWLFTACSDLCRAERSLDFLNTPVRGEKETLLDILRALADGIIAGTPNGIHCDPASALVFSPSHFTWMDTNYPAGTPREGYPIEIQALWFAALRFLAESVPDAGERRKWAEMAGTVRNSIRRYFVLPGGRMWLSDCLHASQGVPAERAVPDDHLRPNQLLAVTLGAVTDMSLCRGILQAASHLLIPGAIRSLDDAGVEYPLPITDAAGRGLNDPLHPYWGHYEGDEDTRRKPAYHNGTAWTWLFPSYAEAYFMTYREAGKATAVSLLSSMTLLMNNGCIAQVPEILDGNQPHTPRGCDAQAWGMTEFYRVWKMLHEKEWSSASSFPPDRGSGAEEERESPSSPAGSAQDKQFPLSSIVFPSSGD